MESEARASLTVFGCSGLTANKLNQHGQRSRANSRCRMTRPNDVVRGTGVWEVSRLRVNWFACTYLFKYEEFEI